MAQPTVQRSREFNFDRMMQDFRQLDPEDPGLWPLMPRLAVLLLLFVIVLGVAWYLDWSSLWAELDQKRAEEVKLKEDWLGKKKQTVNLDEYRKQLAEIDRNFSALLKQLPSKTEMDNLLVDVNQAGLGRGLQFEQWKPDPEQTRDFYAEVPVKIKLTGAYHDIGNFVGDVAKLPRIVTLDNVSLKGSEDGNGPLKLEATAMTYRYLDADEVAKKQKEKAAAKKGGK